MKEPICLLHNTRTCGKRQTIARSRDDRKVRVAYAYAWGTHSDNTALIYETVNGIFQDLQGRYPDTTFDFQTLGGKDGSIYCDICRQIRTADIVLLDISNHNPNVILELGLAIGSGAYVFILRSAHYKRSSKGLSDLNGILEYRFSRRNGHVKFQADFVRSLTSKLCVAAKERSGEITTSVA